ncbi:biotin-dependent carboxyltransferase family protein [Halobacillus salinus]|uniref:Biotin-dependent carboxyltransferase family protein n=1 Tax=Halobacillus salinus TaxID=192814 RepID=A0A4Z0GW05_9BACI|nr:biotin-dependent carboxyltransferase family protein [Halobacillus salinus]TGB01438.1 biotin-dependent carboxyltransferase family protein [Halobacillus salinus]
MSNPIFEIVKPGLLTTLQDEGRHGYQQYGIVASGAMDPYALKIANFLVGNDGGEAALEVTVMGPEMEVLGDAVVAITGANLSPRVNGHSVSMWKSFAVKQGDLLEFGQPVSGARAYISVAGGYDVPVVMGSKSTYLKAGMGGFEGRALDKGDVLSKGEDVVGVKGRALRPEETPVYEREMEIRVIPGPHLDAFSEDALKTFLSSTYEVTPQSDRMGYRLKGPKLEHQTSADIISEAIPLGGIQVPANGQPILLMADRQTTGGYTRIATVISSDIPYLAQAMPGCKLRFREVSVEEAQELYRERERFLRTIGRVATV